MFHFFFSCLCIYFISFFVFFPRFDSVLNFDLMVYLCQNILCSNDCLLSQQLFCRIHSSWTVPSTAITTIRAPSDNSLVRWGFPWMRRKIIAEEMLWAILWHSQFQCLRPTACDTTHSSLPCRISRKLSFNLDGFLVLHLARLQPLVHSIPF